MGRLTTHVLDLAAGVPGRGIAIRVFSINEATRKLIAAAVTNQDGRCGKPLIEGADFTSGHYEIEFDVGTPFFDVVPVRIRISDPAQDYHVPLLISPFGYSTYRGS